MHNSHEKLKSKKLSQELRHSEKTSADIAHPFLKKVLDKLQIYALVLQMTN